MPSALSKLVVVIVSLGFFLTGCATDGDSSAADPAGPVQPFDPAAVPALSPRVDSMELDTFPVAVNLDDKPGADGISVKMRLYSLDQPLAFAMQKGVVEFVMYEGRVRDNMLADAQPHHIWRFSASQIAGSGRKVLVGWQYDLTLNWLDKAPKTDAFTLTARLLRPGGQPLYARPVFLTIGIR